MPKQVEINPQSILIGYWLSFQIIWFLSVCYGTPISILLTLTYLILHFYFVRINHSLLYWRWPQEVVWVALFLLLGVIVESLLLWLGTLKGLQIEHHNNFYSPPIWLLNLWIAFGVSLRPCMSLIQKHPFFFIAISMVAAPISYRIGSHLNTQIQLTEPNWKSMLIIGVFWGLSMLIVIKANQFYFSRQPNAR